MTPEKALELPDLTFDLLETPGIPERPSYVQEIQTIIADLRLRFISPGEAEERIVRIVERERL